MSLLLSPALASAQVTLVVRAGGDPSRAVEAAVDEALRETLGGSVRRVDSSMDDLALAAGCPAPAVESECVARVAAAAGVRIVALERFARDGEAWAVSLDLRHADGSRIRRLDARCASELACADALTAGFETREPAPEPGVTIEATTSAASTPYEPDADAARGAPSPGLVARPDGDGRPPGAAPSAALGDGALGPGGRATIPIVPNVLFASATLVGVGAAVSGALAITFANDAAALGARRRGAESERAAALHDQSAAALGLGIALTVLGAGFAVAGAITLVEGRAAAGPRVTLSPVSLTVVF